MGSDGADSSDGGIGSDPSSHPDYGGNYSGDLGSFGIGSDPSSHPDYGGNYSGDPGSFGSGGFSWSGLMDNISNMMSAMSLASTLGLNPAVGIPAYGLYKTFDYAWSNRNNPSVQPDPVEPSYGVGSSPGVAQQQVQYQSNQSQVRQDWANFLNEVSNKTRSRVARTGQEQTFTSLLED